MKIKSFLLLILLIFSLSCNKQVHIEQNKNTSDGDLGIEGILPVVGKIYIDDVAVQTETDGSINEMTKFHQIYKLSSDIIIDDITRLNGGICEWESKSQSALFDGGKNSIETPLVFNESTLTYECNNVTVEVKQTGDEADYEPDSIVTVKYKDKNGSYIIPVTIGSIDPYVSQITLNAADRHNIKDITTSPTTSLFWRKDGLFKLVLQHTEVCLGCSS